MTTTPTPHPRPADPAALDAAPARFRSPVEQLILDLSAVWLARWDAASVLPRGDVFDPDDPREALQALRERAADRVQRMPIDDDSADERAERAEESGSWMSLQLATSSLHNDPREALWRATTAGLVDGWTVLYLLGQIRTHQPRLAEHVATVLNTGAPGLPAEQMPKYVLEWAAALRAGRSLLPLLP